MEWCMLVSYSSRDNVTYRVMVSRDEGVDHVYSLGHASLVL